MKKLILLLCLLIPLITSAQTESVPEKEEIFVIVETMPEYSGGMDSLYSYLRSAIKYPEDAIKEDKEGVVFVKFIVKASGEVADAEVVRGVYESLDKEALRVVSLMPNWTPGTQKGKPVNVYFTIPIRFKL